jgi:uncharacterized protein (TIGR02266 family)
MALREVRQAIPARRHGVSINDADLPETLGRARADSGTELLGTTDEDGPWVPPVSKLPTTRVPPRRAALRAQRPAVTVDRRSAPRRVCMLDVEFTDDVQFYRGVTQDLSAGGLFVRTRVVLPISSAVALRFELLDGTSVEAHARVRWVCDGSGGRRAGLGLEFTALSRGALQRIIGFCNVGARF